MGRCGRLRRGCPTTPTRCGGRKTARRLGRRIVAVSRCGGRGWDRCLGDGAVRGAGSGVRETARWPGSSLEGGRWRGGRGPRLKADDDDDMPGARGRCGGRSGVRSFPRGNARHLEEGRWCAWHVEAQRPAQTGNDRPVRFLLSKEATAGISSCEGTPLLHVAVSHGEIDIIKSLLQHNADPNRVCSDLGTPMTAAVLCAEVICVAPGKISKSVALKCMKLLVKAGADLNCTTPDTPLVIATSKDLSECVKYLLEVGADANIPINHGKQSDKDSKVKRKEDASASKSCSEANRMDPANAMMYLHRSLRHVMSSEAHVAADCVRLRPNWRKDDQSSSASNVQAVGQESVSDCQISDAKFVGSALTAGSSDQAIVAQQLVDKIVQIFVKVLDHPSISLQIECNSSIREMVYTVLVKRHIYLSDLYVKCGGRMISPESTLLLSVTNSTYTIVPRLRGGVPNDPPSTMNMDVGYVPLLDHIVKTGDKLFEVVKFRGNWALWLSAHYCVFLGKDGREIYRMLFHLIEYYHGNNRCPVEFTLHNIRYLPRFKSLVFHNVHDCPFSKEMYLKNLENIRTILVEMFRYDPSKLFPKRQSGFHKLDPNIGVHPHLVLDVIKQLKSTIDHPEPETGLTEKWRSRFLIDPAGKSSAARTALILGVDLHYDYLALQTQKDTFNKCFEVLNSDWTVKIQRIAPMKKVLDHKIWDKHNQQYFGVTWDPRSSGDLWTYGRNWVTHSDSKLTAKEAEVIISFLYPWLLSKSTKALLCDYVDPNPPDNLEENRTKVAEILNME